MAKQPHVWVVESQWWVGPDFATISTWTPIFHPPEQTRSLAMAIARSQKLLYPLRKFRIRKYVRSEP